MDAEASAQIGAERDERSADRPAQRTYYRANRRVVPDARWPIEEQSAEVDTVVTRFRARGTPQGPPWGWPATGRISTPRAPPGPLEGET
jgi:predicted ester cyclase